MSFLSSIFRLSRAETPHFTKTVEPKKAPDVAAALASSESIDSAKLDPKRVRLFRPLDRGVDEAEDPILNCILIELETTNGSYHVIDVNDPLDIHSVLPKLKEPHVHLIIVGTEMAKIEQRGAEFLFPFFARISDTQGDVVVQDLPIQDYFKILKVENLSIYHIETTTSAQELEEKLDAKVPPLALTLPSQTDADREMSGWPLRTTGHGSVLSIQVAAARGEDLDAEIDPVTPVTVQDFDDALSDDDEETPPPALALLLQAEAGSSIEIDDEPPPLKAIDDMGFLRKIICQVREEQTWERELILHKFIDPIFKIVRERREFIPSVQLELMREATEAEVQEFFALLCKVDKEEMDYLRLSRLFLNVDFDKFGAGPILLSSEEIDKLFDMYKGLVDLADKVREEESRKIDLDERIPGFSKLDEMRLNRWIKTWVPSKEAVSTLEVTERLQEEVMFKGSIEEVHEFLQLLALERKEPSDRDRIRHIFAQCVDLGDASMWNMHKILMSNRAINELGKAVIEMNKQSKSAWAIQSARFNRL